jgi:hypothetical protein
MVSTFLYFTHLLFNSAVGIWRRVASNDGMAGKLLFGKDLVRYSRALVKVKF